MMKRNPLPSPIPSMDQHSLALLNSMVVNLAAAKLAIWFLTNGNKTDVIIPSTVQPDLSRYRIQQHRDSAGNLHIRVEPEE